MISRRWPSFSAPTVPHRTPTRYWRSAQLAEQLRRLGGVGTGREVQIGGDSAQHHVPHRSTHQVQLVTGRREALAEFLRDGGDVEGCGGWGGSGFGHDANEDSPRASPHPRGGATVATVPTWLGFIWTSPNTLIGLILGLFTFHVPRRSEGALIFDRLPARGLAALMPRVQPRRDDGGHRDHLGRARRPGACSGTNSTTSVSTACGDRCSCPCTSSWRSPTATGDIRWRSGRRSRRGNARRTINA